jgi:hypothetical protein
MFSEQLQQLCIHVIASLIEPILTLFQVKIELLWFDAMKLMQPTLDITPETLDPVDVMCATHELVRSVLYYLSELHESRSLLRKYP